MGTRLGTDLAKRLGVRLGAGLDTADPFVLLGADRAWRAEDAIDNGTVTTSIPNYIGTPLALPATGTGQGVKAPSANLGNQMVVPFVNGAGRAYGNVIAFGATPAEMTIVSVWRYASTNRGCVAFTLGGVINSGFSQFVSSATRETSKALKQGQAAICAATLLAPRSVAQASTYTAAGASDYSNTYTAGVLTLAGALAGTTLHLGELDSTGTFTLSGEWATTGYWSRQLSPSEIATVLTLLGARYGIPITGTPPSFATIVALAAGRPVFNGDFYIVDGVSGKVRSIVDWSDPTHVLDQSNAALQVAIPVAHADFAGQRCYTSTGAEFYVSNRPAAAFNYMHDGPVVDYTVLTRTATGAAQLLLETALGSGVGMTRGWSAGGSLVQSVLQTAGVFQSLTVAGVHAINLPSVIKSVRDASATPMHSIFRTGAAAATGSLAGPAGGNATLALTFLGRTATALGAQARTALLMLAPGAADQVAIEQAIQSLYGIVPTFAGVLALAGGRPVFNADNYIVDGISGKVRSVVDWSNPARILDQPTAANQCAVPIASATYGGKLALVFTGVEFYTSNQPSSAWVYLHDGLGTAWLSVHNQTNTTGNQNLYNTRGGIGLSVNTLAASASQRAFIGAPGAVLDLVYGGTVNVPRQFFLSYTEGASPEYRIKTTSLGEATGSSSGTPTTSNPATTLLFGVGFIGDWRSWWTGPDISPSATAALRGYFAAETGVAA